MSFIALLKERHSILQQINVINDGLQRLLPLCHTGYTDDKTWWRIKNLERMLTDNGADVPAIQAELDSMNASFEVVKAKAHEDYKKLEATVHPLTKREGELWDEIQKRIAADPSKKQLLGMRF